MQAIAVLDSKELFGLGNWSNVRVVCVVGSLLHVLQMVLVRFPEIYSGVFGRQIWLLVHAEDWLIDRLALFQVHLFRQSDPHWLFPSQEVFFHCSGAIVSFTSSPNTMSSKLRQGRVELAHHGVVVFVGIVSQAKCDILQVG